ncbi:MAG: alpha/beta fold hydrolase [Beijerinckiaceae bacterium]
MPISRANGLDIYYEKAGVGPPLMLIHALPFNHNLWQYQVASLSNRFTTYAVDLRGWGRSGKPRTPFSLGDMCADVMGVLDDEDVKGPVLLMGCSIGSKIALKLACEQPDRISGAILIGGNSGRPDFSRRIADYRAQAKAGTLADYHRGHLRHGVTKQWADTDLGSFIIEGFVDRDGKLDAESIAQVFGAMEGSDLTEARRGCRVPILVVNGEFDSAFQGGAETAADIRGAQRVVVEGAGHCCFIEKPDRFDAIVRTFLTEKRLWPNAR